MNRIASFAAALALIVIASRSCAQDAIAIAWRASTVYIESGPKGNSVAGSGVCVACEGDTGYIVTTASVVSGSSGEARTPIFVMFSATAPDGQTLAEVAGLHKGLGLALLKVKLKELKPAAPPRELASLTETTALLVLGGAPKNGGLICTQCQLDSIRHSEYRELRALQLDGELTPQHAGAPVVDASGVWVGVLSKHIPGTGLSTATPASAALDMVNGCADTPEFNCPDLAAPARLSVTVPLLDPLTKIRSAKILLVDAKGLAVQPEPARDGTWNALPGSVRFDLVLHNRTAAASVVAPADARGCLYQIEIAYADGRTRLFEPGNITTALTMKMAPPPADAPKKDWIRAALGLSNAAAQLGVPCETGKSAVYWQPVMMAGCKVRTLNVDAGSVLPCMTWSADSKFVYTLELSGLLRKISVPDLVEQRQLNIGHNCSHLALSKEGLVVSVFDIGQVWVLDEATLAIKKKIHVDAAAPALSALSLSVAYMSFPDAGVILVVDLHDGTISNYIRIEKLTQRRMRSFHTPAVSPDGKYFFCTNYGGLCRFKIDVNSLVLEESGPSLGTQPHRIEFSGDSSKVVLIDVFGNKAPAGFPPIGFGGEYIFKTTDLAKPLYAFSTGGWHRTIGIDPKRPLLYSENMMNALVVTNSSGAILNEIFPDAYEGGPRQFLVHPDGGKLFMLTSARLVWVEVP